MQSTRLKNLSLSSLANYSKSMTISLFSSRKGQPRENLSLTNNADKCGTPYRHIYICASEISSPERREFASRRLSFIQRNNCHSRRFNWHIDNICLPLPSIRSLSITRRIVVFFVGINTLHCTGLMENAWIAVLILFFLTINPLSKLILLHYVNFH